MKYLLCIWVWMTVATALFGCTDTAKNAVRPIEESEVPLATAARKAPATEGGILYSWHMSALEGEGKENLLAWIDQVKIRTLYQEFNSDYLSDGDDTFLIEMAERKVEVFYLCGTPEWMRRPERMMEEIDKVVRFNSTAKVPLGGIVFDVEPHSATGYNKETDFQIYVRTLEEVYAHAQANGIYMVVAIPYWLEQLDGAVLSDLITSASDEVSVMNYNERTTQNLTDEILLSRQCGKPINTIYEVGSSKGATFDSLDQIAEDFEALYETFAYDKLRIAYHYLDALRLSN